MAAVVVMVVTAWSCVIKETWTQRVRVRGEGKRERGEGKRERGRGDLWLLAIRVGLLATFIVFCSLYH